MSQKKKKDKSDDFLSETSNINDSTVRKCWTCDAPLYHCPYIKCIKCHEMEQCVQCFSTAATCEGHGTDHSFVLMDYCPEPLTREDWSTEEEALLLFGIQMCGVGNWHDISKVILTKDPREIEKHYYTTYIESDTAPYPPNEIQPPLIPDPPLPFDTTPRDSRPSIAHEYNLHLRGKEKATTPAEYAGWMPKRHEFDIEYMNEAEELISDITFNEKTETKQSLQFKIKQMLSYNKHLKERHKRTELALEWNLGDNQVLSLGGTTPEEIQIEQQLIMPMAQAIPKNEILKFTDALHEENRTKEEIKTLIEWRENGIMTLDEGFIYNKLKKLLNQKHVTDPEVRDWNELIQRAMKKPEFRASIEREILSNEENDFVMKENLSPIDFIKIKEFLMNEFEYRGRLTTKIIDEILEVPDPKIYKVFEFIKKSGMFITLNESRENLLRDLKSIKKSNTTQAEAKESNEKKIEKSEKSEKNENNKEIIKKSTSKSSKSKNTVPNKKAQKKEEEEDESETIFESSSE
ncbi:Transcriptional adapter 2-alpha [Tritrichomonas musculus]|uniref:Transcriptional adapter 2-alpha n=1 Tax=Tritrichomonas musculus TaxID=1915356 RepID=A0ABR2KUU1_9EUKA